MGKCKYNEEGGKECGRETVTLSDYCETHQLTATSEPTLTIEPSPGGGLAEIRPRELPDGLGGGPPAIKKGTI
jgi:hypothetical protein